MAETTRILPAPPLAAAGGACPQAPLPAYLERYYWWAYLRPASIVVFDHNLIVSAILWGQYRRLKEAALAEIAPGQRVLQAACVYGDLTPALARRVGRGGRIDVIDITPLQVANCRRKLRGLPQATVRRADAAAPAAPGTAAYDVVLCFFLLHELPDARKRAVVEALLRRAAPGGKVVFVDYHRPRRGHPLAPAVRLVFALLEPFASAMWWHQIVDFAPQPSAFAWRKRLYCGGLFQKVVARRRAAAGPSAPDVQTEAPMPMFEFEDAAERDVSSRSGDPEQIWRHAMYARDVMTENVVTVEPETSVADIARLLLERHISAVPVVDSDGRLVGIVSEGDLMRRPELDTGQRRRSWWLSLFTEPATLATEFNKSHGLHADDVMSRNVIVVADDAPLAEVAEILEANRIKRVPVMHDDKLVGIVSRADLLRGLATLKREARPPVAEDDRAIKKELMARLDKEPWVDRAFVNVTVSDGVVHLWGMAETEAQRKAFEVAAEGVPGVRAVENHLGESLPIIYWGE